MKRIPILLLVGAMLFAVIGFNGCISEDKRALSANASIGIIETRGTDETSRIILYDSELNEVAELPLRYANLGGIFYDPLVYGGSLFTIPQGKYKIKNDATVLQVDVESLATKTHAFKQTTMNDVAVSDAYIFTCGSSSIQRCRMDNGDVSSVSIEGMYVSKLIWCEGSLYAFGMSIDGSSMILHYDENLVLQESIDCSNDYSNVYRAVVHEDKIYFCSVDLAGKQIGVLDTKDNTLTSIQLNKGGSSSVAIADGKLYVAHYNVVQGQDGSALSVVDLKTGSIEEHAFDHGALQMTITEGSIYLLADWAIYRYDAENVEFIGSVAIEKMPGSYSYLSGLFSVN